MARRPVRGEWVGDQWQEWAPEKCDACGHDRLLRGWGQRPCCRVMGRTWTCRRCDAVTVEPDHGCRNDGAGSSS